MSVLFRAGTICLQGGQRKVRELVAKPYEAQHGNQLGAVVTHDRLGLAALAQQSIELASDPHPRDRGVGDERQALARAIVDHDEDAQAAAVDELVGSEVERPAVIRPLCNRQWCPCAQGLLASTPSEVGGLPPNSCAHRARRAYFFRRASSITLFSDEPKRS
jgi:hypothetical protein